MKKLFIRLFIVLFWISVATMNLFSTMKSQLVLNENQKEFINKIFPQGWGFFTKDPQDFELNIYKVVNGKIYKIKTKNQSVENKFGLSRSSRMIGYEISMIAQKIKQTDWVNCETRNIYSGLKNETINIKNVDSLHYFGKGNYILKLSKPVPYSWAKQDQEKFNPFSIAKIQIK